MFKPIVTGELSLRVMQTQPRISHRETFRLFLDGDTGQLLRYCGFCCKMAVDGSGRAGLNVCLTEFKDFIMEQVLI